jgi:hypothetical protein
MLLLNAAVDGDHDILSLDPAMVIVKAVAPIAGSACVARGFGRCTQCGSSTWDISVIKLPAGKEAAYKYDMCGWAVKVFDVRTTFSSRRAQIGCVAALNLAARSADTPAVLHLAAVCRGAVADLDSDPAADDLQGRAHWPADGAAVAARSYRVGVGSQQMAQVAENVTLERPRTS